MSKPLRRPEPHLIARRDAPASEESLKAALEKTAQQLGGHLGLTDLFAEQLPQALFDLFDNYDPAIGLIVSETFINHTLRHPRTSVEVLRHWASRGIKAAQQELDDRSEPQQPGDPNATPGADS